MAAPTFPANVHRLEPYRAHKFQLLIDSQPVAGLRRMTALRRTTEPIPWRAAGDPSYERTFPGGTTYEPLTLEQGKTHDLVFQQWADLVNNYGGDAAMSLAKYRKDIVLNVLNLQGTIAIRYQIYGAWVSEYTALPDFDAGTMNAVAIESITLQHQGWRRDPAVTEPVET